MLKEIINFTDLLEENKILDKGREKKQNEQDEKKIKVIEVKLNADKKEWKLKKIHDENKKKQYIKFFNLYGLPVGSINNKSIAGSQGLYTASFFMFKYNWSYQNKEAPNNNDEKEWKEFLKSVLLKKFNTTYKEENYKKYKIDKDIKDYFKILESQENETDKNYLNIVSELVDAVWDATKEPPKNQDPFIIIFMMENDVDDFENKIKKQHETYLDLKVFNKEKKITGDNIYICPVCSQKTSVIALPAIFQNSSDKKPFVFHIDREFNNGNNIAVCRQCALKLVNFKTYFLDAFGVNFFPLFITLDGKVENDFNRENITLFKEKNGELQKISFRDIMKKVYENYNDAIYDFYLVMYNGKSGFIDVDYVTGYRYKYRNMSVFEIENLFSSQLIIGYTIDRKDKKKVKIKNNSLAKNYFSEEVDTGDKILDGLLYEYRSRIFEFVYRAKYSTLHKKDFQNIYLRVLHNLLKAAYRVEIEENVYKKLCNAFLRLDEEFCGDFNRKLGEIREDPCFSEEALMYKLGSQVRFLYKKTKRDENKINPSDVEPYFYYSRISQYMEMFINLFYRVKNELPFENISLKKELAEIFKMFGKFLNSEVTDKLKTFFYLGYFRVGEYNEY